MAPICTRLRISIAWLDKAQGDAPDAAEFWYERRTLTRQLLALGEVSKAYDAADGYEGPEGRMVEAHFHAGLPHHIGKLVRQQITLRTHDGVESLRLPVTPGATESRKRARARVHPSARERIRPRGTHAPPPGRPVRLRRRNQMQVRVPFHRGKRGRHLEHASRVSRVVRAGRPVLRHGGQ